MLRQQFPKGTDLSRWSAEEIEAVTHTLNPRPRTQTVPYALAALPREAWRAAPDADCQGRDRAQVAELTRWLPAIFVGWAASGMLVISRMGGTHTGAQLQITHSHGWRITVFATNTTGGLLADLEVRNWLRASRWGPHPHSQRHWPN